MLVPVVRRDAAAPLFTGYESEATDLEPRQEQTIPSAEYEMAVALQSQHGAERQGKASTILRPRVKDGQSKQALLLVVLILRLLTKAFCQGNLNNGI